jgi:large subunit ribosomal protein L21
MFGIISTGSHQYKVRLGEAFKCERISGEVDSIVKFTPIFLSQGNEILNNSEYVVVGKILAHEKEKKIIVFKKKRRKDYKKKRGHRSQTTLIEVTDIIKN